ncbi:signal transduction histidine kinase [Prosthecobacter fusiformis]|uniref:Oxygen sensor histidine kinase NreB n=1 Tax=Prosthecobacter fusiformis TaxID=48464 RepID=A0A4R7RK18_9BACT|nr:sensor histidine kinase [Prosthecobacter fusiformis]TDU63092.1 signal transduction histidine kinase [Prosthecobacter fusiformis]
MKTKPHSRLPGYLPALRKHLVETQAHSLESARRQGLRAVKLGLETLDLARIHEDALISLVLPKASARNLDQRSKRAGAFFAEAIAPIEETHRGARDANAQLKRTIETLTLRTVELANTNQELKKEIIQRRAVEDSLRTSEKTSSQLLEKSRHLQEELRHLSRQLLSAQEQERKRISRELHDVVAQTLASINLRLAGLQTLNTANIKEMRQKIVVTQRLVAKSVDIVHRFARDLRPAMLDDLGLIPALQSSMKGFMERTGIRVELTTFAGVEQLSSVTRTMLYRVAQEALANIARHSKASRATVIIRKARHSIQMEIHDNGQGFKVEGAVFARSSKGLGLLGMRERVEMVGGTFCVKSELGKETTLLVEIPHSIRAGRIAKKKTPNLSLKCP